MIVRLAWLFFFSLLHTSISIGVRLVDTRSTDYKDSTTTEIVLASIFGLALPCLLSLFVFARRYNVKWIPVGAWLPTDDEIINLHGRDLFPKMNHSEDAQEEEEDDEEDDDGKSQSAPPPPPKPEPSMSFEDALLGSPSTADFAMKTVIDKKKKTDAEKAATRKEKEDKAMEETKKNRRRKFLKNEVRGGKWVNDLAVLVRNDKESQQDPSTTHHNEEDKNDGGDETNKNKKTTTKRPKPIASVTRGLALVEPCSNNKVRYGPLFMDFRNDHERFFILHFLASIVLGILHGLSVFRCSHSNPATSASILGVNTSSDDALAYTTAAVLFVEALFFICIQPCRFFYDNIFYTFVLLGSNIAAGCSLLVTSNGRFAGHSDYFIQVSELIILSLFVLKFIFDVFWRIRVSSMCFSDEDEEGDNKGKEVDSSRIWEKEFEDFIVYEAARNLKQEEQDAKKEEEEKNNNSKNTNHDKSKPDAKKDKKDQQQQEEKPRSLAELVQEQMEKEEKENNKNNNDDAKNNKPSARPLKIDTSQIYRMSSASNSPDGSPVSLTHQTSNRIIIDDSSPLRAFNRIEDEKYAKKNGLEYTNNNNSGYYEEEEREMQAIATKNTIERLQTYASKSHYELEDDDEKTKEEKRKINRGLPPGLETFLSLTPPNDKEKEKKKREQEQEQEQESQEESQQQQQPRRLGANGLVEGVSIGPPIAFGDLRLDYSPNYDEERATSIRRKRQEQQQQPTVSFQDNQNDDDGSPVAPLRSALKKLKGSNNAIGLDSDDEEASPSEVGKRTNQLSNNKDEDKGDIALQHKKNDDEESDDDDGDNDREKEKEEGFSFMDTMGSRPGENKKKQEKEKNESDSNDDGSEDDDESEESSPQNPLNNKKKNEQNNNDNTPARIMQQLDSITQGGRGIDMSATTSINNSNASASAKKRLQSLELAGNFLTGAFSVPALPIIQQQGLTPLSAMRKKQKERNVASSNFRDPYYDEFYGADNDKNNSSNPLNKFDDDVELDEDLPYPLPPVRMDKNDYYGAAYTNYNKNSSTSADAAKKEGAHGPLNEYSPGKAKSDVQSLSKIQNTGAAKSQGFNANRPLFSGYFAPTPASKKQHQQREYSPLAAEHDGDNDDDESPRYQPHQPPLRNKDGQRPLLKMFAMQQGSSVVPNNGDHFVKSTPSAKRKQQEMDAFFFSPNSSSSPSTNPAAGSKKQQKSSSSTILNIPSTPTPSRRTFAQVEEL